MMFTRSRQTVSVHKTCMSHGRLFFFFFFFLEHRIATEIEQYRIPLQEHHMCMAHDCGTSSARNELCKC